ncbi:MAG: 2-hydroxyacyl-CoA dehydratase family protein [Candidatus Fermentibacteraceae bacterium]
MAWRGCGLGEGRGSPCPPRPLPVREVCSGGIVTSAAGFGSVDAWAGMYTCDMTRRLFQELERLSGNPVFPLQLPATRTVEAARWFCESVRDLALGLIGAGFSEGYDPSAALAWETDRLAGAAVLREAALSFRVPPLILQELFHGFFVENRFPREVAFGSRTPGVRVAVTGSVLARGDDVVTETLAELGAGYLPLGCTGLSGLPSTVPADGSIRELALASFNDTRCIRNRPNNAVFQWTGEQVTTAGCHGLVLKTLSFCDLWHTEKERFRKMPFPVLVLSSDLSPGERGRTSVRLQAFVETLEARHA